MIGPVERVTLTHLRIPVKEPFLIDGETCPARDAIVVAVACEGSIGLGECSPAAVVAAGSADDCWNALANEVAPTLLGRSFASIDDVASTSASWRVNCSARTGAETACWDLFSQSRHESVAEMLGASSEQLEMGVDSGLAVGLYPTVVDLLEAIEVHLAEGYRRVKIAIRPGRDVDLVRAVRRQFGDISLMVDAGAAYGVDDLEIFRELDDFDLLMFEQPMAADDLDGMAALQKEVLTPVCIDESARSVDDVAEAIRRGACRIVNLRIQRMGGFGPALAAHDLCLQQGIACWVGTTPELGIGQAQGLHLAALPNCRYPTDIEPSARWFVDDYIVPRIEMVTPGILHVPARAGLGYQLDQSKVKRYQVRRDDFTWRTVA
jgi:O-succinylbenzoate synthase